MAVTRCIRERDLDAGERIIGRCEEHADSVHVTSFEGAVLYTREQNGYHDSDFFAGVFDAEAGEVREVMYATTRGWTYHNGAAVDADEETVEAALAAREPLIREVARDSLTREAAGIERGAEVTFTRAFNGRTQARVEKGATGRVFWTGKCKYSRWKDRAGVETGGEKVFVDAAILERTAAGEVDEQEFEARVAQALASDRRRYTIMRRGEAR